MKISYEWLTDFIDWKERDPQVIADRLTASVGEVDELEVQGKLLEHCVVGKVTSMHRHPNADKLFLCDVTTEQGTKKVVCGGTNLNEGMLVAFAHVGAQVKWHGGELMTLAPVKIRGEHSEGMICAAEELDLSSAFPPSKGDGERPIVDLTKHGLKVGTPLREALGMTDVVFHIDNHAITHRPDLFSHIGFARELVALGLAKWKADRKQDKKVRAAFPKTPLPFKFKNEVPKLVPRYCSCLIRVDDLGETPQWMKRRLSAVGWRPVSLPVDITNYVASETGMPLHSFDADDLKGSVKMRIAKAGESITTLDGVKRELNQGAIVIADDTGIFDLLGVMGGLRSSTKDTTRNIYLHSAIVDGASIRRTIIATGHRTDASTVYEKGVPPVTAEMGFYRALQLFLELVPGARIASKLEQWGNNGKTKAITLSHERIASILGVEMKPAETKKILTDLEFAVKPKGKGLSVTPPLHRIGDIHTENDLVEEIGRIHGYQSIENEMPRASIEPPKRDTRLNTLRDALKEEGFFETLHLAFTSEQMIERVKLSAADAVQLENPIGEETSFMRPSLLPALLSTAATQLLQTQSPLLRLYELGHVYRADDEPTAVALVVASRHESTLKDDPLLAAKQGALHALKAAGYNADVHPRTKDHAPTMHPGRSADIVVGKTAVGSLFEVHPSVRSSFGLPERTSVAVIHWDKLAALPPEPNISKPLPAFPAIAYDETVPVSDAVSAAAILKDVRATDPLLKEVEVIDLYQDGAAKRMTLHFVYRADDRTLEQKETDAVHGKVVNELRKRLG